MRRILGSASLGILFAVLAGAVGGASKVKGLWDFLVPIVVLLAAPQAIVTRYILAETAKDLRRARTTSALLASAVLRGLILLLLIALPWSCLLFILAAISQTAVPLTVGAGLALGCLIGLGRAEGGRHYRPIVIPRAGPPFFDNRPGRAA